MASTGYACLVVFGQEGRVSGFLCQQKKANFQWDVGCHLIGLPALSHLTGLLAAWPAHLTCGTSRHFAALRAGAGQGDGEDIAAFAEKPLAHRTLTAQKV